MATLNIKNLPDALYHRLQDRARAEHRSLSQQVIHLLGEAVERGPGRSLLELRGLGRELWTAVEPSEHVARERASWDS